MSDRYSHTRRGVLLLLVLGLLALFGLVAVAFVIVTGHAQRSAKIMQRIDQTLDPPEKLLNETMMQIARGPSNPVSVVGPHSLLEDMYGNNSVEGVIAPGTAAAVCQTSAGQYGGQLISIPAGSVASLQDKIRRVGCVLTMTSSPLMGQSTRIVGYDQTLDKFQLVGFEGITVDATSGAVSVNGQPISGNYIVNGAPFSGTGFGFNSTNGTLDKKDNNNYGLLALEPNAPENRDLSMPGGANEDYDAADYQNMVLATPPLPAPGVPGVQITIPSLHRPALVNYWYRQLFNDATLKGQIPDDATRWKAILQPYGPDYVPGSAPDYIPGTGDDNCTTAAAAANIINLKRKISLRPLTEDNPDFDGSNFRTKQAINNSNIDKYYFIDTIINTKKMQCWEDLGGIVEKNEPSLPSTDPNLDHYVNDPGFQWDVDNDGDGVADSIWVDLGMPVRAARDGRLYKPLFAILAVDMDGRLNLNAHGSLAQADQAYYQAPTLPSGLSYASSFTNTHRGEGYGPADINLGKGLNLSSTDYSNLLAGKMVGTVLLEGRYGSRGVPGNAAVDPLSANKWFNYGINYGQNYWDFLSGSTNPNEEGVYGSPPDPFGTGVIGLDPAGRPLFRTSSPLGENMGGSIANNPYQFDLGPDSAKGLSSSLPTMNNPFSVNELERILRPFDRDATTLPSRITSLVPSLINARQLVTTESWDVPCPAMRQSLVDMIITRGVPSNQISNLLPPEILAGLKMNLNRPFGNGRDDNNNGVVDEPEPQEITNPSLTNETVTFTNSPTGSATENVTYNPTASTTLATNSLQARQLEARYLYVLAMLLCDQTALQTRLTAMGYTEGVPHYLAQWAVNVVDFCDRDSIMTPFPFDTNPWDGWNEPPMTDTAHIVWGCERPELLITETLAFHDRRTQDLDEGGYVNPPNIGDPRETDPGVGDGIQDFDQSYRPQGSLFVELYNPWPENEPKSGDLYNATDGGVDLEKTAPGASGGNPWPVWRMIIVESNSDPEQPDPNDPIAANRPTVERSVYFVSKNGVQVPADGLQQYFPLSPPATARVNPGRYAVIGPGEQDSNSPSHTRTYIGFLSGHTSGTDDTRYIDMNNDPPDMVRNNTNDPVDPPAANLQSPITKIRIDDPFRLSVSEPVGGYPSTNFDVPTEKYLSPTDIPFDDNRTTDPGVDGQPASAVLQKDQTVARYRIIHLQRLANPLLPYSQVTNPYLTIDSMPVDLTAFNGITNAVDPNAIPIGGARIHFESRQRGELNDAIGQYNIWKQEATRKNNWGPAPGSVPSLHNFNDGLKNSFGYLNQPFGVPSSIAGYVGDPQQPFPWLTWNNRPYISPLELLLVPAERSSKLLVKNEDQTNPNFQLLHYRMLKPADPAVHPYGGTQISDIPYTHLMNFFDSNIPGGTTPSPELHRVLEYLDVPSRFVGTEIQGNPTFMAPGIENHWFHPPFNFIPNYREPGKINLNTIYDQRVFDGLMNGFPFDSAGGLSIWDKFKISRRGYNNTSSDILFMDPAYPTQFGQPFRSYSGGSMTPLPSMLPNREINATLLRNSTLLLNGTTVDPSLSAAEADSRSLFQYAPSITQPVDNPDRNPFFRYQGLERLENLVTTRSNVYAVWITVGYFEVKPHKDRTDPNYPNVPPLIDAGHPDGYELGQEMGIDTGEIVRHRAFYMIDRTIPVGFVRGQDLNVEKAIILKRFIE